MKTTKTIIITGTHHTPAIELIHQLQSDLEIDWHIHYISHQFATDTHIAHTIIPQLKTSYHNLDCGKFSRKDIPKTIRQIPQTIKAIFEARRLILEIKPDVVVSFGGYVSVPVIIAAYLTSTPSITHEQTLTNSLSTRLNSLFVKKIALSFDNKSQIKSLPHQKISVTGNLIRAEVFQNSSKKFSPLKPLFAEFPLIYITGGNQGSQFLNSLVTEILPELSKKYTVIHQTGVNFTPPASKNPHYFPVEYIDSEDIGFILHHAAVTISRAGANTCQEFDVLNTKSILIPLPFTQQNEQLLNAQWLQKRHPFTVIVTEQSAVTPQNIIHAVNNLSHLTPNLSAIVTQNSPHLLTKLIHDLV